jgi:hypothetical protein
MKVHVTDRSTDFDFCIFRSGRRTTRREKLSGERQGDGIIVAAAG